MEKVKKNKYVYKAKGEDMKIIDKIIDFVKSIFIHPELLVEGQETKVSEQKINNFMESLQKILKIICIK